MGMRSLQFKLIADIIPNEYSDYAHPMFGPVWEKITPSHINSRLLELILYTTNKLADKKINFNIDIYLDTVAKLNPGNLFEHSDFTDFATNHKMLLEHLHYIATDDSFHTYILNFKNHPNIISSILNYPKYSTEEIIDITNTIIILDDENAVTDITDLIKIIEEPAAEYSVDLDDFFDEFEAKQNSKQEIQAVIREFDEEQTEKIAELDDKDILLEYAELEDNINNDIFREVIKGAAYIIIRTAPDRIFTVAHYISCVKLSREEIVSALSELFTTEQIEDYLENNYRNFRGAVLVVETAKIKTPVMLESSYADAR